MRCSPPDFAARNRKYLWDVNATEESVLKRQNSGRRPSIHNTIDGLSCVFRTPVSLPVRYRFSTCWMTTEFHLALPSLPMPSASKRVDVKCIDLSQSWHTEK